MQPAQMNAEDLIGRYEIQTGWDAHMILSLILARLEALGELREIVRYLDAVAEEELEYMANQ
jgi:hypothetical protein